MKFLGNLDGFLAKLLRFDQAQTLTAGEQSQARTNLGLDERYASLATRSAADLDDLTAFTPVVADGATANRPDNAGNWFVLPFSHAADTGVRAQLAISRASADLRMRYKTSAGAWTSWQKIWHGGNDGVGSGLDADLLDGQSGSFYQSASNLNAGTLPDARLPARLGITASPLSDWNLATGNGLYMASSAANAPPGASGTWYIGFVQNHGAAGYCVQTATQFTSALDEDTRTYRRHQKGGAWGGWFRLRLSETEQQALWDGRFVAQSQIDTDAALTANSDALVASQKAVKAAIAAAIAGVLDSAPGALDTLNELAAAMGNDPSFAASVTNALAGKLAQAGNLSDLQSATAALTNLGLSTDGKALVTAADYAAMWLLLGLGTAASKDAGTAAGNLVQLDGTGKLPPVDASQLVGLPAPSASDIETGLGYAPAAINPNTANNATTFPIGTILLLKTLALRSNNATSTVRLNGTTGFADYGGGSALAGTWRYCGSINTFDSNGVDTTQFYFALMQRVA